MSYHIISCHVISYHIISYHIISYHIISYYFVSFTTVFQRTFGIVFSISGEQSAQKQLAGKDKKFKIKLETTRYVMYKFDVDNYALCVQLTVTDLNCKLKVLDEKRVGQGLMKSHYRSPLSQIILSLDLVSVFTVPGNEVEDGWHKKVPLYVEKRLVWIQ